MTLFLLALFAGACVFLVGWGMLKPGRCCEFPFLAGATFAGFALPQAVAITWNEGHATPGLEAALLMCILCAGMCYLGYVVSDTPMPALPWEFDTDRLLVVAAVLSAIGAFFYYRIRNLPPEMVETGEWHGLPVAYSFFAQVLRYGFAIAILLFIRTQSRWALAIVVFDCLVLLETIVIRARRGPTLEVLLAVMCALWFVRRKAIPRWGVVLSLAGATLALFGTGAYRAAMYQDQAYGGSLRHEVPYEELLKIDFVDVFLTSSQEEAYEFRNLTYLMNSTDSFDGGLSYYNELIYVYVPAQVFGAEFKDSLKFDVPREVTDPNSPNGSTITGMGDSFQAFGWFGCLVFFLIAFMLRKLYETAQAGHIAEQLFYMLVITSTLHAITHNTKWALNVWVHLAVFLLPGLYWARKPSAAAISTTTS